MKLFNDYKVLKYRGSETNSDGQVTISAHQHKKAVGGVTNRHGAALRKMLIGWEDYADASYQTYECPIGEDGLLGPYWAEVGLAIKRLLDGDTGGLDCGSIGNNITDMIEAQGFETDGYSLIEKEEK